LGELAAHAATLQAPSGGNLLASLLLRELNADIPPAGPVQHETTETRQADKHRTIQVMDAPDHIKARFSHAR
jgi:hypothetical protein